MISKEDEEYIERVNERSRGQVGIFGIQLPSTSDPYDLYHGLGRVELNPCSVVEYIVPHFVDADKASLTLLMFLEMGRCSGNDKVVEMTNEGTKQ